MVGNAEAFIDKLRAHFGDPKLADGVDEAVFLADYLKELSYYSESCLHLAATQLITTRDRRTFPTLAECLKVCRDVHEKLAAAEVPPPPNKDHWPEHSEERVKKADRLIQCPLGRQAADEGWIMGLHEFCRETGKLPDRYEAERVKAKLMAQLAERRPIEAVGGRHVAPLFRAWRQREERLKKLVYGTPSTDASGQAA